MVQYLAAPLGGAAITKPIAASEASVVSVPTTAVATVPTTATSSAPVTVSIASSPSNAQVEGASTEVAPATVAASNASSDANTFVRQLLRAFAEPLAVSNWILALCAIVLVVVIALTFFMHLHIQPTNMLMGAAFVAVVAISFIGINARLAGTSSDASPNTSLAASAIESSGSPAQAGVVIDTDAAQTGYALFPQQ